jgi:hypothetical protein
MSVSKFAIFFFKYGFTFSFNFRVEKTKEYAIIQNSIVCIYCMYSTHDIQSRIKDARLGIEKL